MAAVHLGGKGLDLTVPIFVVLAAPARLIVLQDEEMAPENIVCEAAAILLLAIAAYIVMRAGKS